MLDEVVDPKITDVNMAGLFGSGTATLYELDGTLVIAGVEIVSAGMMSIGGAGAMSVAVGSVLGWSGLS